MSITIHYDEGIIKTVDVYDASPEVKDLGGGALMIDFEVDGKAADNSPHVRVFLSDARLHRLVGKAALLLLARTAK